MNLFRHQDIYRASGFSKPMTFAFSGGWALMR